MRRGGLGLTGAVRAFMSAGMINPVINLSRTAERVRPIGTADRQRARSSATRMLQATSGALSITAAAAYGVSYLVPQEPVYAGAGHRRSSLLDAGRELAKQRFQCGDWWEWQYRDGQGITSSRERYVVHSVAGDEVIIDMESKLDEREDFQVHHRMHLSLADALSSTQDRKQWNLIKFGFMRDGRWLEAPYTDNVQAFEEKFDCFLMAASWVPKQHAVVHPTSPEDESLPVSHRTTIGAIGDATLVQTPRHSYAGSWYVSEPKEYAGLAAFKAFGVEGASDTYTFELVATGRGHDAQASLQPSLAQHRGAHTT